MKKVSSLFLVCLILTIYGCGQQSKTPVETNTDPVAQEIPVEIEKVIDSYSLAFENQRNRQDVALSPIIDIINGGPDSGWDVYFVAFLWGQFFGIPSDIAVTTDWTGSLSVNGEAEITVVHQIDFEENQDYLIDNGEPSIAEWVSITEGDFDGLTFIVLVNNNVAYFAPLFMTFKSEPFQLEIPIEKLVMYKGFYMVDDHNGVAVFARKIWHNPCAAGYMEGKWIKDDNTGDTGHLEGLWYNRIKNEPEGIFVGQFWTDDDGNRLFEGSVSGYITDHVIAYFKGRWYYDDYRLCPMPWCGTGHGVFAGKFEFVDREGWGYLGGVFGWATDDAEEIELPLKGHWKQKCRTITDSNSWDSVYQ